MATITSLTSSSASYGVNSKGIGGIATGLDTDEIIKGMTVSTRSKIARQFQNKQLLTWQSEAYRKISSKLIDFSKKYTSFTSNTNLLSSSFYTKTNISTSGSNASKISVSGNSNITENISIISASRASSGGAISSKNASDQIILGENVDFSDISNTLSDKNISFSLNSKISNISFSKEELIGIDDAEKMASLFQTKLNSAFGKDTIKAEPVGGAVQFRTSNSGSTLKISDIHVDAKKVLGLNAGESNRLDLLAAITIPEPIDLLIDGTIINLSSPLSTQDIINEINNSGSNITVSYIESLDRFEFKNDSGKDITISGNLSEQLFGGTVNVKTSTKAFLEVQYGNENTLTLESTNNIFNIDGLTLTINETFSLGDPIRLSAKTDTDKIFNAIKEMISEYNDIVDLVNTEYSTKPNRNYPPLTNEQKEEMTESEIKVWEEKAKAGLLFGNSDLASLTRELRTAFFSNGDTMYELKKIGVTPSSNWQDKGKIVISEDNLRKAIEEDPVNIKEQFADGIMSRLKNITDKYVKTDSSSKGVLIEKAGHPASPLSLTKNTLLDQMNLVDKIVEKLNLTLSREQSRYYQQFANLETVMSKLNSQSGWLSQQFG